MLLSDQDIKAYMSTNDIIITPLADKAIQPASVDVRLGSHILLMDRNIRHEVRGEKLWIRHELSRVDPFFIDPGAFILAPLLESVTISNKIAASIHGKSSLGRTGLQIHCTAGYVDPGWSGILTLEMSNIGHVPIPLKAGMKIAQLRFDLLSSPTDKPYGHPDLDSKYQGAREAETTRYYD